MPNLPTFSRRRETSMRAPLIRSVLDLIPSLSLSILDSASRRRGWHPSWPACRVLTVSIMGHGHDGSSFVSVPALLYASRARGNILYPFSASKAGDGLSMASWAERC